MPLVGWLFHGDADTYRYIRRLSSDTRGSEASSV
jgi:hypothetical protein